MTEAEWLNTFRPTGMLLHIRSRVSERKVLLLYIACCRRIWGLLGEEDCKRANQAERSADDHEAIQRLIKELEPEQLASLALAGL